MADPVFTLGVEEEYQIVNPETRELRPRGKQVLAGAQPALGEEVQPELRLSQIETATHVCRTLPEVRDQVRRLRREVIAAAERDGDRIVAAGTHPFSHPEEQPFTPKERYRGIVADYKLLADELVIFGCHVHVGIQDPEVAVEVLNRARIWLTPLLVLSASSPFWLGADTGYASFRTELWTRWPMAGQPQPFRDRAEYEELIRCLVATGAIADETRIYWDIRIPRRVPTVEFRVADVCSTVDETVMIAGLVRGLVRASYEGMRLNTPYIRARPELLKSAHWRAARYGLEGELIDVSALERVPAPVLVQRLLAHVRPALEAEGDWDEVSHLAREVLRRGNSSQRQRAVYQRSGRLEAVVDHLVGETREGVGG